MKLHIAASIVSLLAFYDQAIAQSCSAFSIEAFSGSSSVSGGNLYSATNYVQYPGPPSTTSFTLFDLSPNGTLSSNGAQCQFSPYLVCDPDVSSDEANDFSLSDRGGYIRYANDSGFLICPEFAINHQPISSLGSATTLTQSTQVRSGTVQVPSTTPTSISLSYILRRDGLVFVSSPGSCLSAPLIARACADDGTDAAEPTSTVNHAAQRTAITGGVLGGAALVGAFLL